MKNLLLVLVFVGLIAGAGFTGYKFVYPIFFPNPTDQTTEQITDNTDTPTDVQSEPEISTEDEVIVEETNTSTDSSKRKVPILSSKKLFENTFIRFAYPSSLEIQTKTMNSLEVFKDTERIGTIAIYNNDEGLPLNEFLKKDNLVDYFTEGAKFNITPTNFDLPTAEAAVMFKNFPGFVTSDIAVIEFPNLIIIVSDSSNNDIIQEYIVPSLEKIN